jgi:hypothetical protein
MFILHIQKPIAPTQWLDSPDHLRQQNQTSEQQWRTGGGRSLPDRSLPPAVYILNSLFSVNGKELQKKNPMSALSGQLMARP